MADSGLVQILSIDSLKASSQEAPNQYKHWKPILSSEHMKLV